MKAYRPTLAAKFRNAGWSTNEEVRHDLVKTAAALESVVDLSLGDPDLPSPPNVVEAGMRALAEGRTHYAPNAGILPLRKAIAQRISEDYGLEVDPEHEIIVTHGCSEASLIALLTFLDPGDEVLVADPYFPGHLTAVIAAGGAPVLVPTYPEDGFRLSCRGLAHALSPRTKALLLVSPHNPTGAILDRARLEEIADLVRRHDLLVISDEVYEKLIFDDQVHIPFATLPGMRERTITVSGFSKSYCMSGWRIGYLVADVSLTDHLLKVRRATSICTSPVSQYAALEALSSRTKPYLEEIVATYSGRRKAFLSSLSREGVGYAGGAGSFFVMVDVRPSGMSSNAAASRLLRKGHVLTWPGSMFGEQGEGFLRAALVAHLPVLEEAAHHFRLLFD